jgi:hypothetical protein
MERTLEHPSKFEVVLTNYDVLTNKAGSALLAGASVIIPLGVMTTPRRRRMTACLLAS